MPLLHNRPIDPNLSQLYYDDLDYRAMQQCKQKIQIISNDLRSALNYAGQTPLITPDQYSQLLEIQELVNKLQINLDK